MEKEKPGNQKWEEESHQFACDDGSEAMSRLVLLVLMTDIMKVGVSWVSKGIISLSLVMDDNISEINMTYLSKSKGARLDESHIAVVHVCQTLLLDAHMTMSILPPPQTQRWMKWRSQDTELLVSVVVCLAG